MVQLTQDGNGSPGFRQRALQSLLRGVRNWGGGLLCAKEIFLLFTLLLAQKFLSVVTMGMQLHAMREVILTKKEKPNIYNSGSQLLSFMLLTKLSVLSHKNTH